MYSLGHTGLGAAQAGGLGVMATVKTGSMSRLGSGAMSVNR